MVPFVLYLAVCYSVLLYISFFLQTSFVAGKVKGGRTVNTTSPLDAAISASSAPSVHRSDQELYVSDDELFNN